MEEKISHYGSLRPAKQTSVIPKRKIVPRSAAIIEQIKKCSWQEVQHPKVKYHFQLERSTITLFVKQSERLILQGNFSMGWDQLCFVLSINLYDTAMCVHIVFLVIFIEEMPPNKF